MSSVETFIQAAGSSLFPASDWATIDAAGSDTADAHSATVRLCEVYWRPTYHFVRRTWPRKPPHEALEATQEFFTRRMEEHDIRNVDKTRRFRNWLKGRVSNFLRKLWQAEKRAREHLSLESIGTEGCGELEPRSTLDPCRSLERNRALDRLDRVFARLEQEYARRGDAAFARDARRLLIPGEAEATYIELEERWGMSPGTLKVRIYSMRQRFRTLLCEDLGVPPDDPDPSDPALALLYSDLAQKEEQPCPKEKALPARPSP